jgi:type IV pilus assembly protein PilZ
MESDLLSILIRDKRDLYAAYMPFVENGGLFVPTTR